MNGIFDKTKKATSLTEISSYFEEFQEFCTDKLIQDQSFNVETLSASVNMIEYNTKSKYEENSSEKNIKDIIPDLNDNYYKNGYFQIINGKLILFRDTQNPDGTDSQLAMLCKKAGIEVSNFNITADGTLLSSKRNLELQTKEGTLAIPEGVKKIGQGAFALEGIKKIIMPSSCIEIGENAFKNCKSLEEIVLNNGLERIDNYAFYECENLKEINLPKSLTYLGEFAISKCYKLKSITFPENLKEINACVLWCDTSLTTINFTKQESILGEAFNGLPMLDNLYIPNTVKSMGFTKYSDEAEYKNTYNTPFLGTSSLNNIMIDSNNQNFIFEDGMIKTKDKKTIIYVTPNKYSESTDFYIPSGTEKFYSTIGSNVTKFVLCNSLNDLFSDLGFFPDSISQILIDGLNPVFAVENNCLYKNNQLIFSSYSGENLKIKDGCTTLRRQCFKSNSRSSIKTLVLPNSVETIEREVLQDLWNLQSLKIGNGLQNVTAFSFGGKSGIKIEIDPSNPYLSSIDGINIYSKDGKKLIAITEDTKEVYTINDSVTEIGDFACSCKNVKKYIFPSNLKKIDNYAFIGCGNLTYVELPSSLEEISSNAFSYFYAGVETKLSKVIVHCSKSKIKNNNNSPFGLMTGERGIIWDNNKEYTFDDTGDVIKK